MKEWQEEKIGNFLSERKGKYKPNADEVSNLPRINKIDFSGCFHIVNKPSRTNMILVEPGDFVISGIGVHNGSMGIYEGNGNVTATIHYSSYIVDKTKIEVEYFKRFLKSPKFIQLINTQVRGGMRPEIKAKHLLPLTINLPPLNKQKEIVEHCQSFESEVDKLSSELTHQQTLITKLRQQILQEAIEGKLTVDWRKQNPNAEPASKLLKRIAAEKEQLIKDKKIKKQKPLPLISNKENPLKLPKGWEWCRLRDVTEIIMGQSPLGETYNHKGIGTPFFQGKKEFGDIYPVGNSTWCSEPKRLSKNNDVLISVRAPVGDVNLSDKKYAIGRGLTIIRPFSKNLYYWFLFYFLRAIQNNWKKKGSFFDSINKNIIEEKTLPLPPLQEQKTIVAKVEKLLNICDQLEEQNRANQIRDKQLTQTLLRETFGMD